MLPVAGCMAIAAGGDTGSRDDLCDQDLLKLTLHRLKAGSIGHSADVRHSTVKHLFGILRSLFTGSIAPNRSFEFIRTKNLEARLCE